MISIIAHHVNTPIKILQHIYLILVVLKLFNIKNCRHQQSVTIADVRMSNCCLLSTTAGQLQDYLKRGGWDAKLKPQESFKMFEKLQDTSHVHVSHLVYFQVQPDNTDFL